MDEKSRKSEGTLRILVHGDITELKEDLSKRGIEVVEVDEDNHILIVPQCKVNSGAIKQSGLITRDRYPSIKKYVESGENSLQDAVTSGISIILTGVFDPVDQEKEPKSYDYEAEGKIRVYNDPIITSVNLMLSSENDISEYYGFVEYMLDKSKTSKMPEVKIPEK